MLSYAPSPLLDLIDIFQSDPSLVITRGGARLQRRELGQLRIVSGQLAACDPRVSARDAAPFARLIPPGTYPVDVGLVVRESSGEKRVAFARIRISESIPVRWVNALPIGVTTADPVSGEAYGYDVEAGVGCFADVTALRAFDECGEDAMDEAIASMQKNDEKAWTWADIRCGDDGENVIIFSSGDGDGCYASFWGLDATGAPAWLVTDFGLFGVAWRDPSP